MKRGKRICETLKDIRRDIAQANEIDYEPTPCTYEGDCSGTCPKCESEVRWLERQLRLRQSLGKAVTIAGLGIAMSSLASCNPFQTAGEVADEKLPAIVDTTELEKGAVGDQDTLKVPVNNPRDSFRQQREVAVVPDSSGNATTTKPKPKTSSKPK